MTVHTCKHPIQGDEDAAFAFMVDNGKVLFCRVRTEPYLGFFLRYLPVPIFHVTSVRQQSILCLHPELV